MKKLFTLGAILVAIAAGVWFVNRLRNPKIGNVKDEPLLAGVKAEQLKAADDDYFHDMDGGPTLSQDEIKGRNTWIVWTAGNDRMWDQLSVTSVEIGRAHV